MKRSWILTSVKQPTGPRRHSKNADPDFEEVFDDTQVKRLDLVVTEDRWQSMLDNMAGTVWRVRPTRGNAGLVDTGEDPISFCRGLFTTARNGIG